MTVTFFYKCLVDETMILACCCKTVFNGCVLDLYGRSPSFTPLGALGSGAFGGLGSPTLGQFLSISTPDVQSLKDQFRVFQIYLNVALTCHTDVERVSVGFLVLTSKSKLKV